MKISKLKASTSTRSLPGVGNFPRQNRTSKGMQKAQHADSNFEGEAVPPAPGRPMKMRANGGSVKRADGGEVEKDDPVQDYHLAQSDRYSKVRQGADILGNIGKGAAALGTGATLAGSKRFGPAALVGGALTAGGNALMRHATDLDARPGKHRAMAKKLDASDLPGRSEKEKD